MKKTLMALALATASQAAEIVGTVSEAGCGAKHKDGGPAAEKCVSACVRKGAAPVLVDGDRILRFANAEKVMDHLGKKVRITGNVSDDTVTVQSIQESKQ
jgi:hypothetical protein